MSKLVGDVKPEPEALKKMQDRGGDWYAYQNQDMSSADLGHLQFLQCGAGCTFEIPPIRMPDTHERIGWRYGFIGKVNTESGEIEEVEK